MSTESVAEATERAIAAAGDALADADAGALAALRVLAVKIDKDDDLRASYLEHMPEGGRPLQLDNVSIPTYLKYCESLGLTPAGRVKLEPGKPKPAAPASGRVAKLRAVRGA